MASAAAQPATADTSASHPYTCNTCQVAYRSTDLQKTHMKSDWHRYNLKRRVASLPPISSETFTDKVLQARAVTSAEADKAYFERECEACEKKYYSENAYQNHLLSQKHKLKEASGGKPSVDESASVISSTFTLGEPLPVARRDSVDADAEEEFSHVVEGLQKAKISEQQRPSPVKRPSNPQISNVHDASDQDTSEANGRESGAATPVPAEPEIAWTTKSCLFCNYTSPSIDLNTHHMERFHGMFIPEKTYLVDLDGLLDQLQQKIHEGHECLSCGQVKSTVFGVQTHMRDKGHCKIPFETEYQQLEIGDHYDFRSTYSDGEEEPSEDGEEENGGARLGGRRKTKTTGEDGEEVVVGEGEGWETDSDASSLDSDDLTGVPAEGHQHQYDRMKNHPHHSSQDIGQRHKADGWHSHAHKHTHAVFHDEYELHLPSGKSVGHRSLNKYYRQNLVNYPTPEERAERQMLEDGNADDDHSGEGDNRVATRDDGRGRAMVPRGAMGMVGVSDHGKKLAARAVQKNRTAQDTYNKKSSYAVSKKLNNHKNYYYRELGGG